MDLGTVTSGSNWLLERQGSGGEWGEVEMFPDLEQVERRNKCWVPLKANICWVPNKFYHTRPKPGRQGLAGSWGKDAVWQMKFSFRRSARIGYC